MLTKKSGYLVAMLTGLVIVGAATAGVSAAHTGQSTDLSANAPMTTQAPRSSPTSNPSTSAEGPPVTTGSAVTPAAPG